MHITTDMIAAMPEAVAMHASPPSSAARRFWNIVTVGFVKREYVYASSAFLKRSAASAALEKQKLDVSNSASACSLNSLRKVPARRAGTLVRNPVTGEMVKAAAKPASVRVKIRALSKLKTAAGS